MTARTASTHFVAKKNLTRASLKCRGSRIEALNDNLSPEIDGGDDKVN
jgi:hypothetical protein